MRRPQWRADRRYAQPKALLGVSSSAPQPIRVMSLLSSPTGHPTNLSAAPGRP